MIIDSDQHLYETRTTWIDHIDPARRDDALRIEDDELGYPWVTWRGRKLQPVDVQFPGRTSELGERRERIRAGLPPLSRYDDDLPREYWDPSARADQLAKMGLDDAVVFPNFGLLWERTLDADLGCADRQHDGVEPVVRARRHRRSGTGASGRARHHARSRLVARASSRELERADVRLAMVAPALVDGRALSHPDHDALWQAFVDHGVTPVFHVADQRRVFGDGWYASTPEQFLPPLDSVFLWVAGALGATDLILNGTFEKFPELKLGIVELSAVWVPLFLMMLDGGSAFTAKLNGRPLQELSMKPSDYFRKHVRVSSFSYELPARLIRQTGDVYMCCSDYPHSEGTADPIGDYEGSAMPLREQDAPGMFHDNVSFLLART